MILNKIFCFKRGIVIMFIKNSINSDMKNFGKDNLEYILRPFEIDKKHSNQAYVLKQANSLCKVKPSVDCMKNTIIDLMN